MKIVELYQDYGIQTAPDGHRHGGSDDWVNIECPFCEGNPGFHLGFNLENEYYYCFRCGSHFVDEVISEILGVSKSKAKDIIREYSGQTLKNKETKIKPKAKILKYPSGVTELQKQHRRYLERRGFNPDYLAKEYGILGTGPIALLDGIDYKHRILAPIHSDKQIVTFQTRDITGKSELKYMACPKDREVIHHKELLYGLKGGMTGIGVEGIFDVWALGEPAVGLFGIEYKPQQVKLIAKNFSRFVVVFDPDPQAKKQARKLVSQLKMTGVDASWIPIDNDPADMAEKDRKHLLNQIL